MLDDVLDFLPPDLEGTSVRALALIPRAFDRPSGQVLVVERADGRRAILTRPSDFELFREIPVRATSPIALVRGPEATSLEVHVIDGRVLRLALEDAEIAPLAELLEARPAPRPEIVPETSRARASRRATLRPPESVEAEVVVVPDRVLKPSRTPLPEPIRGDGAVEDLARRILADAQPKRPSPRPARTAPQSPPPARAASSPEPRTRLAVTDEHDSGVPPALAPSQEALGSASEESARHESVRPPAFTPQPMLAVSSPRDTTALRARFQRHWERGELDEASQVARVLAFLGAADSTEKRLASLAGDQPPTLARPLSAQLFKAYVAHEDEDPDVARLGAALWPTLLTMRLRPERELGLRARDEVDVASADGGFPLAFRRAARSLALPPPRLWVRTDIPGGLAHLNVSPIGSLCGGSLPGAFSADELTFLAAHHLSFYRPEVYLFALLPGPQDLLTLACAALVLERRMAPEPRLAKVASSLDRFMVPQVRDSLRIACAELALSGDPRTHVAAELARLRRAAHLSAVRAGFVLTGSIAVAARMTRLLPAQVGLDKEELVDDLATYAISPAWLALRRELGLALAPSSPETPL